MASHGKWAQAGDNACTLNVMTTSTGTAVNMKKYFLIVIQLTSCSVNNPALQYYRNIIIIFIVICHISGKDFAPAV